MQSEAQVFTAHGELPHNLSVEEAILGGIILDPEAIERVVDILEPRAFFIMSHQVIYQAILELYQQDKPRDLLSLTAYLADRGRLADVGGQHYLAQLVGRTVSTVNIDALAELINDKFQSRCLIDAGHTIANLGYDMCIPILDRIDNAETVIYAISQKQTRNEPELVNTIGLQIWQEFQEFEVSGGKPGLDTPFYDLNTVLGNGLSPGLFVIGGRPSMGKSMFGAQLAFEMAEYHDRPSMIFSLEMDKSQVVERFLSARSGIPVPQLRSRQFVHVDDANKLLRAIEEVGAVRALIDDTSCPTVAEIRSKVRRTIARHGKPCLVVVDYLQLMIGGNDEDNEVRLIGQVTRQLKLLSRECDIPILLLSQLNRGVESRQNKRPCMSDLRGSGTIEQDADVVAMLYRDEYYNVDSPDRGICEVIIAKNRTGGSTGTVKLLFDGEHCQFRNLAKV